MSCPSSTSSASRHDSARPVSALARWPRRTAIALGYTAFGSSRDEDAPPDVGEVRTFFVLPSAWRRGVGPVAHGARARGSGRSSASQSTVWSFADNARANAFYEHHGFERDGSERREDAWADILEVRYAPELAWPR